MLFEEKREMQWRRLQTRKMALGRRELSRQTRLEMGRAVKNNSEGKEKALEKEKHRNN